MNNYYNIIGIIIISFKSHWNNLKVYFKRIKVLFYII